MAAPAPDPSAERVARNNATFREANESIGSAAREYGVESGVPFICECPEEQCTAIIRAALEDYEQIRSDPTRFIYAPGHAAAAGPHATVLERREGYDVTVKVGEAADLVTRRETRS